MPTTPILSPNQTRAFQLYYKQAADKLNLVNTVMLESTQSAYQQAVTGVVNEIELADRMARTYTALDNHGRFYMESSVEACNRPSEGRRDCRVH